MSRGVFIEANVKQWQSWFSNRMGTSVDDGACKSNNWLDQWQSGKLATKAAFSPFRVLSRRQLAFPFCFSHSGVRLQGWQTSGLLLLSKKKLRFYNALDKKERFRRFTYIIRRIRIEKLNRRIFAKQKPIYCHHEGTSCHVALHVPWVPETSLARFPRPTAEDVSIGLRPTPKIPAAREKNLWYPGYPAWETDKIKIRSK